MNFKRHLLCSLVIGLFFSVISYAQTQVSGVVTDTNQEFLPYINIIVKDSLDSKTFNFTFTDDQGRYNIQINDIGSYILVFKSLGYRQKQISFNVDEVSKKLTFNVVLEVSVSQLDEVIIKSEKPITVRKDTISLKTNLFTDGTEQTVAVFLKKYRE